MKTQVRLALAFALSVLLCTAGHGASAGTNAGEARQGEVHGASHAALLPVSVAIGAAAGPAIQDPDEGPSRWHGPVVRVGQDYRLAAGEVAGEVRTILGDATLEGHVRRDAFVILGSVQVKASAVVDGALVVIGGSATIEPGAAIARELVVIGGALDAPPGFTPGGDLIAVGSPGIGDALHALVPWLTRGLLWGRVIVPDLGWVWMIFGFVLLASLVANFLFDKPAAVSADAVLERPVSVFLLGLLVLILTVPVLAILAATVIGLAVVPFVVCAILLAGLIGKVGVARAIGRSLVGDWLQPSRLASLVTFVLGAALLTVTYMVPVLGLVTWAFTTILAFGAAAVMLRRRMRVEQRDRKRAAAARAVRTDPQPVIGAPGPADEAGAAPAFTGAVASSFAEAPDAEPGFGDAPRPSEPPPPYQPPPFEPPPPAGTLRPEPPPISTRGGLFPLATFLDRVAAFALDAILVALVVQWLDLSRFEGAFPLLLVAYHVGFWTWKGTTLGGVVVGLRVTRTQGQDLRFADALVRGLSGVFSIAALGIGCFWMLQDPARQMWHDKIAGTQVLKVPREVVLQEN